MPVDDEPLLDLLEPSELPELPESPVAPWIAFCRFSPMPAKASSAICRSRSVIVLMNEEVLLLMVSSKPELRAALRIEAIKPPPPPYPPEPRPAEPASPIDG